jgi:hypothetical protein
LAEGRRQNVNTQEIIAYLERHKKRQQDAADRNNMLGTPLAQEMAMYHEGIGEGLAIAIRIIRDESRP